MRVDRFLIARFPQLPFSHIQSIARKGELRVDMKRVDTNDRIEAGQKVRVPPLKLSTDGQRPRGQQFKEGDVRAFLKSITLYEDADVLVIDKPAGLAVQGLTDTIFFRPEVQLIALFSLATLAASVHGAGASLLPPRRP